MKKIIKLFKYQKNIIKNRVETKQIKINFSYQNKGFYLYSNKSLKALDRNQNKNRDQ